MSNIERFEELLRSDETLQAKLRAAADAFDGDKQDERAIFDAIVAPLAVEVGLPFTFDEGKEFAVSSAELSDEELAAVAGGGQDGYGRPDDGCIFIGLSVGGDACTSESGGAGACCGLGIGFLGF